MTELASVYLLWGDNAPQIRSAVAKIRDALFGEGRPGHGLEAFNTERFDAPYVRSSAEVLTACAQLPVMAERRLVELSGPEAFGKPSPTITMARPSSGLVVVASKRAMASSMPAPTWVPLHGGMEPLPQESRLLMAEESAS